jgi:hypothetical protein
MVAITYMNSGKWLFFLVLPFWCLATAQAPKGHSPATGEAIHMDTITGCFLYEVNVPNKCYTRWDQIEQGNNLVFFDSLIGKKPIDELYRKGVFMFEYQPVIARFIEKRRAGIAQNTASIKRFRDSIGFATHEHDRLYTRNLYYDSKKILTYKKVRATFVVLPVKALEQLVPDTRHYTCCYANKTEKLDTYFITDVLEFNIAN